MKNVESAIDPVEHFSSRLRRSQIEKIKEGAVFENRTTHHRWTLQEFHQHIVALGLDQYERLRARGPKKKGREVAA